MAMTAFDPEGLFCIDEKTKADQFYKGCGNIREWKVTYRKPEGMKTGFVVQRVTWRIEVRDCDGNLIRRTVKCAIDKAMTTAEEGPTELWVGYELFWLRDGKLRKGSNEASTERGNTDFDDDFSSYRLDGDSYFTKSKGSKAVQGIAFLFDGETPPGGWEKWRTVATLPPFDGMASRCSPPFANDAEVRRLSKAVVVRELQVDWDCCDPCKTDPGPKVIIDEKDRCK